MAIARSIISEPKILLLDEATSALDPHAEGIVQQALERASRDRTTIVIAHKLATIRNADNIVVMSKGKIVEQGVHNDLVARGGVYATLVKAQDLSPDNIAKTDEDDEEVEEVEQKEQVLEQTQSLAKVRTAEASRLAMLKDREDHELYKQTGLIASIWRLAREASQLKFWYLVTLLACTGGGESRCQPVSESIY